MSVYPFTPAGVSALQAELYALDDPDLLTQAKSLVIDVNSWLNAHFSLSTRQQAYIASAPPNVKFSWGALLSAAIIQRAEIKMDDVPTDYGPPRRTKEITLNPTGDSMYAPPVTGLGQITGTLGLTISYQLVD